MVETWYQRHLLPRLIDLGCSSPQVAALRRRVVPQAEGRVVEIGLGSGLNLPFYDPARVSEVIGVDPAPSILRRARGRIAAAPMPVSLEVLSGESLPFETGSADSLVCTFSLCTIPDPAAALAEMRRVLKRGGCLYFAEHGASPDPAVRRWQDRLNRPWGRLAGGCNLNRPILALIEAAGFLPEDPDCGYLAAAPRFAGYCTSGRARRAD